MTALEAHRHAMARADAAYHAERSGKHGRAAHLYGVAHRFEAVAVSMIPASLTRTRGILWRSADALAWKAARALGRRGRRAR